MLLRATVTDRPPLYSIALVSAAALAYGKSSGQEAAVLEALERVGLAGYANRDVGNLSGGEAQRINLANSLGSSLVDALYVLDEPTIGLDIVSKDAVRRFLLELNRERGTTVLLSSHILAEVEKLCDRVTIIREGRAVRQGRWKLVEQTTADEQMLFDLDADPGETKNLIDDPQYASTIKDHCKLLEAWESKLIPAPTIKT